MKLESLDGFGAPCKSATVAPGEKITASDLRRDGLQSVSELLMEYEIPFTRIATGGYLAQGKYGNIEVPEIIAYADRDKLISIINSPITEPAVTATAEAKETADDDSKMSGALKVGGILLLLTACGLALNSLRSKPKALAGTPPVKLPVKPSGSPVKSTKRLATVHL